MLPLFWEDCFLSPLSRGLSLFGLRTLFWEDCFLNPSSHELPSAVSCTGIRKPIKPFHRIELFLIHVSVSFTASSGGRGGEGRLLVKLDVVSASFRTHSQPESSVVPAKAIAMRASLAGSHTCGYGTLWMGQHTLQENRHATIHTQSFSGFLQPSSIPLFLLFSSLPFLSVFFLKYTHMHARLFPCATPCLQIAYVCMIPSWAERMVCGRFVNVACKCTSQQPWKRTPQ